VALPGFSRQLGAQPLGGVDLDDDLALEVRAGAEAEVLMGRPSEAITASMETSTIWVDAELERDVRAVVGRDDRARLLLVDLEGRLRRLAQPLRVDRFPGIRGIGDPGRHDPPEYSGRGRPLRSPCGSAAWAYRTRAAPFP